jgi:hypothetical protein
VVQRLRAIAVSVSFLTCVALGAVPANAKGPAESNTVDKTAREITHAVMQEHGGREKAFVVNTQPTGGQSMDGEGIPPWANVINAPENFLRCEGGPFALCYYSGPDGTLPCTVKNLKNHGRTIADCSCIEIPYGKYYVDINAIMDTQTYQSTVEACGSSGIACARTTNKAPVCEAINSRKLIPGAEMISVFSFNCAPEEGIDQIPCEAGIYAGCMTAPCYRNPDDPAGIVRCECPLYEGCYEVGTPEGDGGTCELGSKNVWSSAHNQIGGLNCPQPAQDECPQSTTYPRPVPDETCQPDAPQGTRDACGDPVACPLFPDHQLPPVPIPDAELDALPLTELCASVCAEYEQCGAGKEAGADPDYLQHAYTCDAVLCTSSCAVAGSFQDDLLLTTEACKDLPSCAGTPGISSIVALEDKLGCSCCASQVCGCREEQITESTQRELYRLNQAQCDRGIRPQCCLNHTLCGEEDGRSFYDLCDSCPSKP